MIKCMSFSANSTGGKYKRELSATIGAVNDNIGAIGYYYETMTSYQQAHGTGGTYNVYGGFTTTNNWNHSTPVVEHYVNDRQTDFRTPYIVIYFWRRTA